MGQVQEVHGNPNVWFLALNHVKIGERWKIGNELHVRRDAWLRDQQQFLERPYVVFKIREGVSAVAGYTYILTSPYGDYPLPIAQPEHNVWEQITLDHQYEKLRVSHRFRMEHRWRGQLASLVNDEVIVDGYGFSNRARYRLTMSRDFTPELFWVAFDELWVNFNNRMQLTSFDRNWVFAALGYRFVQHGNIQLGYLHQWGRNSDLRYERHHTVQLVIQYDLL